MLELLKFAPLNVWKPDHLISTLCHLKPCLPLIECFRVAVSTLSPHLLEGIQGNNMNPASFSNETKSDDVTDASIDVEWEYSCIVTSQRVEDYANHMSETLPSFVQSLNTTGVLPGSLKPNIALSALSVLCIAFSIYPESVLFIKIFKKMLAWLSWIAEQASQGTSIAVDISTYLEGIHNVLHLQRATFKENNNPLQDKNYNVNVMLAVLKLPWTHTFLDNHNLLPWKTKCLSLQVLSKLGPSLSSEDAFEVLYLGLRDEAVEVRTEAAISMPVMLLLSGHSVSHVLDRINFFLFSSQQCISSFKLLARMEVCG